MLLKKKLIAGVLVLGISLSAVSSAFAYDGWADSQQTAYQLQGPVLGISTVLDKPYDVDWYSWTNNTGSSKTIKAVLQSPSGLKYDFAMIRPSGTTSYVSTIEPGSLVSIEYAPIRAGETFYFQVRGQTFSQYSATALYNFSVTIT